VNIRPKWDETDGSVAFAKRMVTMTAEKINGSDFINNEGLAPGLYWPGLTNG